MAVIDARPNNNYWHFIDVWETGAQDRNNRYREIGIRYWVDVRVSGSSGSWTGGSTRRFSAWVDGADHARDLSFDTRNGADFTVLDVRQWVYAGDGRSIPVHGYFEGWSSSFPGFHDTGGSFWVNRVEPLPPPVNRPDPITFLGMSNETVDSFGFNYRTNGDGGAAITSHEVQWWIPGGTLIWTDVNCRGYSDPQGGRIAGAPALLPGSEYHVRGRVGNSAGWSDYSPFYAGRTLPGARVKSGGSWRWAIPYVKQNGVWRMARPYGKAGGTWRAAT